MMKKRFKQEGGFTLIEVIVSLALLGIGAMLLVTFFGSSLTMLQDSAAITAENAEAAGETEAAAASGDATGEAGTVTITFPSGDVSVGGKYMSYGSYIAFVPS